MAAMPGPLRTVIADDNDAIRLLLRTILSLDPDFEVVGEARTGPEAIDVVMAGGVDLLVLDLSLPELDGLEVLERLGRTSPEVRVVVFSGLTREGVERQARSLGARDFIVKGVEPAVLLERLRAVAA